MRRLGVSSGKPDHPRLRTDEARLAGEAGTRAVIQKLLFGLLLTCLGAAAPADPIRIATFNASLSRGLPGKLLTDIERGHEQVEAVAAIIRHVRPDILLLNEIDHDPEGRALTAFLAKLAEGEDGVTYSHSFTAPPNTGVPSRVDLNGDGKTMGPEDAYGFGRFPGQYGMALLSRFPIGPVRRFSDLKWQDVPEARQPTRRNGAPFPSERAAEVRRLSSKDHWDAQVQIDGRALHILASHPTPPVFDGPEDANGLRNADEIAFWTRYLSGTAYPDNAGRVSAAPAVPVVVLGDLNLDGADGDGIREAILDLLAHPRLQDPMPKGAGGVAAARQGVNATHRGDPALDTADWNDRRGPGNLRVDYVLPDRALTVTGSGVFWPAPGEVGFEWIGSGKPVSSDHRLVWVDLIP